MNAHRDVLGRLRIRLRLLALIRTEALWSVDSSDFRSQPSADRQNDGLLLQ
jgi:hypothetical protein